MLSSSAHLTLVQFLSDFISAFIWLSLTCAWLAFGAHMAHTWLAFGSHMAHIWRTFGAHLAHIWLALVRTRLALSSRLKTDFIISPIVTVLYYVLCSVFVFMSTSVSIILVLLATWRQVLLFLFVELWDLKVLLPEFLQSHFGSIS